MESSYAILGRGGVSFCMLAFLLFLFSLHEENFSFPPPSPLGVSPHLRKALLFSFLRSRLDLDWTGLDWLGGEDAVLALAAVCLTRLSATAVLDCFCSHLSLSLLLLVSLPCHFLLLFTALSCEVSL